jgi:hypothetical protein
LPATVGQQKSNEQTAFFAALELNILLSILDIRCPCGSGEKSLTA